MLDQRAAAEDPRARRYADLKNMLLREGIAVSFKRVRHPSIGTTTYKLSISLVGTSDDEAHGLMLTALEGAASAAIDIFDV